MMTRDEMEAEMERLRDFSFKDPGYPKFENIPAERRKSNRHDLNAFLLLDALVPGTDRILAGAAHDEIFLETNIDALASVVTLESLFDLVACGVRIGDHGGLAMFA